jgi:hypothetical protein
MKHSTTTTTDTAANAMEPIARHGRARWAAVGAALAVTIGAGGIMSASASIDSGERTVFVPITPCRLTDTRVAPETRGPRATPLKADETYTVQVVGTNGDCTIPADAVGVSLNVTAEAPTDASYLTVFPANAPRPLASNLNWITNQAPVPNAVTSDLSPDGKVSFYNHSGTVNVIADIVGYYADHNHDDRYYTKEQVEEAVAAQAEGAAASARPLVAFVGGQQKVFVGFQEPSVVRTIEIDTPTSGTMVVNYSASVYEDTQGDLVRCSLTTGTSVNTDYDQVFESSGVAGGRYGALAGTIGFNVASSGHVSVNLVCQHFGTPDGTTEVMDSTMTATFTPSGPVTDI